MFLLFILLPSQLDTFFSYTVISASSAFRSVLFEDNSWPSKIKIGLTLQSIASEVQTHESEFHKMFFLTYLLFVYRYRQNELILQQTRNLFILITFIAITIVDKNDWFFILCRKSRITWVLVRPIWCSHFVTFFICVIKGISAIPLQDHNFFHL